MTDSTRLVLASGSPRRRELLENMGVAFSVHVTNTDESRFDAESPSDFVARIAQAKAYVASTELDIDSDVAILAADTAVVQANTVFGKPHDLQHAKRIWRSLSDTNHLVMTSVCLLHRAKLHSRTSVTEVEFGAISDRQMERYWATGEPSDKAGAYAIQGFASAWVKVIHGSYSNVVGLPLREVNDLLTSIDLHWL